MTTILVTGKTGQVGWELRTTLAPLGTVIALDRGEMDLASPDSIRRAIRDARPEVIVNAAAYTAVDKAESEPDLAQQVNGVAPGIMAEEARRLGAVLIHYSTDYVFDGELGRPYTEEDAPNPVNVYGKTKLAGEHAIEAIGGKFLVLRTSGVYSARGSNFVLTILRRAREQEELRVVDDQAGSPTWARALARATEGLIRQKELLSDQSGVYHLAAAGHTSRFELANAVISIARKHAVSADTWARVRPIKSDEIPLPARRPSRPVMAQDRIRKDFGVTMDHWEDQLTSCLVEMLQANAPP